MVRDIFHISGFLVRNARGHIVEMVINQRNAHHSCGAARMAWICSFAQRTLPSIGA
jgi:hypothetical protein